ncbi:MAG: lipid-A-disaccharide synthase [Leptospiraceae bacterium]|nr:lipid-A-disaccharide synthase [Leptospiraceae bacterium]
MAKKKAIRPRKKSVSKPVAVGPAIGGAAKAPEFLVIHSHLDKAVERLDQMQARAKAGTSPKKRVAKKTTTPASIRQSSQKTSVPSSRPGRTASRSPVLIVSGEHSGDLLGAELMTAMQRFGFTDFFGTGGDAMSDQGLTVIEHIRTMNVMGFIEALQAWRRLKELALRLVDEAVQRHASLAILIDYPGFNLRLAAMLKERGLEIIYVVSPQVWAWKYGRVHKIKKLVDLMLPLFDFEAEIYQREGVTAEAIGHPMIHRLPRSARKEGFLPLASGNPARTIALVPGSRMGEVSRLLEPMLQAACLLKADEQNTRFLLPCADAALLPFIESWTKKFEDLNIEICVGQTARVMQASDLLIIASGTATLEGVFFKKPMVILYRVSWLNFALAALFMRVRYIGIVNILARRQTVLELLQSEVSPANIYHEVNRILTDADYRLAMLQEMNYVRRQMGSGNPAANAAQRIVDFVQGRSG